MYFTKKSEVAVLLAFLLVLVGSSLLIVKGVGTGITGAAVIGIQDVGIRGITTISACQELNLSGETYQLSQSVTSLTTCFTIMNHSITLDCNKWGIAFGLVGGPGDMGINNSGGYDNITITDCNIALTGVSGTGIYFLNSANNTIKYNNITGTINGITGIALVNTSDTMILFNNLTSLGTSTIAILLNDTLTKNNLLVNNNFTISNAGNATQQRGLVFNSLIYNNSFGQIIWNTSNMTFNVSLSLNRFIYLENNLVGLADLDPNSANFLNSSALIQIRSLMYEQTPDLLKSGIRCDNSDNPAFRCNVTYDRVLGILSANITSFSNYSTQENDPPNVTIVSPTNGSNFSYTLVDFNVTITDTFSNVSNVTFQFSNISSPFNISPANHSFTGWGIDNLNMSMFTEGLQGFRVFANDTYNNTNNSVFINFTVDRSAPSVSTNSPSDGETLSGTAQTFNGIFTDTYTSVQSVNFQFSNGSGIAFNKTGTFATGNIWEITGGLNTRSMMESQVHTVTYFANDSVGNLNNSFTITVTVDNTPPYVNITNPYNWTNFSSGTYNFNATIRNVSTGAASFLGESQLDTVIFQFSNATGTSFNRTPTNVSGTWNVALDLTSLIEGVSVMTVFANDTENNRNNSQTVTFIVDRTSPNVTRNFLNNPVDNSNFSIRSSNQTFNASIFDNTTQISTVYFQFDNGTSQDVNVTGINNSGQWSVSYNVSTLAEGKQGVRIIANDTVNNVNDTNFINFTVDKSAPNVSITSPANGITISGTHAFNARITDSFTVVNTVIFQFQFTNSTPFNRTASNSSGTWNVSVDTTLLPEGGLTVTVFANDTVGNLNSTQILSLTVDNIAGTNSGGGEAATTEVSTSPTSTPTPSAPAEAAPAAPSASSETASASEAASAFQSGESSVSISSIGTKGVTTYTSERNYKVTITNNLNKKIVLTGNLAQKELETPLENEENIIKRIKEELLLEGEADGAALGKELSILKLLENIEILQVFKTKLAHLLPSSLVNSVSLPLIPTGKHIEGNLLKDVLLNAQELENIEVNPGQTIEKEVKIRQGLSLDKKAPQIVFSSGGKQVLLRDVEAHRELLTGTAVDVDPKTKKLDFYIVIPPTSEGDKETFTVEMNINAKTVRDSSSPFQFHLFGNQDVFSELYGPYNVNLKKGALLAVQYDASALPADYEVVGKVYKQGTELVSENKFEIKG